MGNKPVLTEEEWKKLKQEVEDKQGEVIEKGQEKGRLADLGDLEENAEHTAASETYHQKRGELQELNSLVKNAKVVSKDEISTDHVSYGTTVTVRDLDEEETYDYTIRHQRVGDISSGDIFYDSPVAKGLLGLKIGDKAEIETPAGTKSYEVQDITVE